VTAATLDTRLPNRGEVADLLLPTVRRLCKEQGFRFIPKGKSKHPKLFAPDGEQWCSLPTTLFDGPVRHKYESNLRRMGADLTFRSAGTVRPSFSDDGMTYVTVESPWTDSEWRERQRDEVWWRRRIAALQELDEPAEAEPEVRRLDPYIEGLMERLEQGTRPRVREDATGNGRWTLAEARQMLRDGYDLEHVIQRTGWGRMWLADLADRLAAS